jgi:hypothetical protein
MGAGLRKSCVGKELSWEKTELSAPTGVLALHSVSWRSCNYTYRVVSFYLVSQYLLEAKVASIREARVCTLKFL